MERHRVRVDLPKQARDRAVAHPGVGGASPLLTLQRTVGNRAVVKLIDSQVIRRSINLAGLYYSPAELIDLLQADSGVVWHDEYIPEIEAFDAQKRMFGDKGKLMMALAGSVMAGRAPAPAAVPAAVPAALAVPGPVPAGGKGKRRASAPKKAVVPPDITLAGLAKAAPVGGTAGQRYDVQGDIHVSVTFKQSGVHGVVRIVGFHRTVPSGSHMYWAKHEGGGKFVMSTPGGAALDVIDRSRHLENAWKAVKKVAAKAGCEAVEPPWRT